MTKTLALLLLLAPAAQARTLRVVATTPDLADIVRRVGGDAVSVDAVARGPEDIHQVVMRPSFVVKLNRADAVVYYGLGLEHSFLPALLEAAANPSAKADPVLGCSGPACVECSAGIAVLEKPATLSRAEGEIHPQGNPHYNLGAENGVIIARNVAAALTRLSPADAPAFKKNLEAFSAELEAKAAALRALAAPLKGVKAVSFHKDVAYLGRFTGLDFVATVEPKPGVAPTPAHLAGLVKQMKEQGVTLIVREQQFEPKTCQWLAEQTGAKVAVIAAMGNALPATGTFAGLSETNIRALLKALGKDPS